MNVLLISDQPLYCIGFVHALTRARASVQARSALSLEEGLRTAAAWEGMQVALIDFRLDGRDGLAALRRFRARFPAVACALISALDERCLVEGARAAGARGVLGKSLSIAELLAALDQICRGSESFATSGAVAPGTPRLATRRQREILSLVALGQQNKIIADDLGIAERTVKLHITALLSLTGARNRTQLVVRAREQGLV